jgi:hypothetical protein
MKDSKRDNYMKWAKNALGYMTEYQKTKSEKAWICAQTCGACLAELDRSHKEEITQLVQSFVWEVAYLRKEVEYERYLNSGYFKEKYLIRG